MKAHRLWAASTTMAVGISILLVGFNGNPIPAESLNQLSRAQVVEILSQYQAAGKPAARKENPSRWTPDASRNYARQKINKYKWSHQHYECLDELWTRESNWRHRAENKSSGAYGIPQALPAEKMSRIADDYRHNPKTQIKWGMLYIKQRYDDPCKALDHHDRRNWY